jgi:predicted transcriptional regulator
MNTESETKKYLNKYFKSQFINEKDDEFKALVKLLNQAKVVKNCNMPPVSVNEVSVCSARKSYYSCDLHHDNQHGCLECGNCEQTER